MSTLREQQLAEGLKDYLIGVQKSRQIYEQLSKLERKALQMNEKEIEKAARIIASKVEKFCIKIEKNTGSKPSPDEIKKRIAVELNNCAT